MTTSKRMGAVLMGLLMVSGGAGLAYADADDTNNADQFVIRITPNVDFGVTIDTTGLASGGVIDLGTVNLGASTQTVRPATVTIQGNVASGGLNTGQELDLSVAFSDLWDFDETPSTDSTSNEIDKLAVYALFTLTTKVEAPTGDDFADGTAQASYVGGLARAGGSPAANGDRFEYTAGTIDMDDKSPDDAAHLWMFFRTPSQTSTGDVQDVTVTLTAVSAAS